MPERRRHRVFRLRLHTLAHAGVKAADEISINSISSTFSMLTLSKRPPAGKRRKLMNRRFASHCAKRDFISPLHKSTLLYAMGVIK